MELEREVMGLLLVAAIVTAMAALVFSVAAINGQRRVRRAYRAFSGGSRDDVLTLLERHVGEVRALRDDVAAVALRNDELRRLLRSTMSQVATVRYDAFDDMGGRLSFSTAVLDEHGDGVVITSINGRTETRTYAKTLTGGQSDHNLSEEEVVAIERARGLHARTAGSGGSGPRVPRPRSRRAVDA